MRGVANETNLVFIKPRRAANRDQRSGRIVFEIVEQVRHERHRVRKFFIEETAHFIVRFGRGKAARSFEFPKKRAGERAVRVRQRDHHKTFARPDMERVLFHLP